MKYFAIALSLFLSVTISCKKSTPSVKPQGVYTGTFQQLPDGPKVDVVLDFSENKWKGGTDDNVFLYPYPAICNGTFTYTSPNDITFLNECAWTANFDGRLILNGAYQIVSDGKMLHLSRAFDDGKTNEYKLQKL